MMLFASSSLRDGYDMIPSMYAVSCRDSSSLTGAMELKCQADQLTLMQLDSQNEQPSWTA